MCANMDNDLSIKHRRICIVGAGVSGLPAIKSCVDEQLIPVCYEKSNDIGGLWNYRPNDAQINGATVMKSTIVNTSKEMMSYSDYPPPIDFPNFMHHSLVNTYLHMYAKHFDLNKYIQLNTAVVKIERHSDKCSWSVSLSNGTVETFDGVMLCTGHHAMPHTPTFTDIDQFEGRILHAHNYRDSTGFEDINVLVIGFGNSALDIAVELSRVAKKVTVSTRRGSWIFNRVATGGIPYDMIYTSRLFNYLFKLLPWSIVNDYMEHKLQQRMDHDMYGLRPNHRFFQQHPTVNDALANLIASGMLFVVDDVSRFQKNGALLCDGKFIEADVIILCTGYSFSFPYLEPQQLIPVENNQVSLYKYIFPMDVSGLAVIGLVQPLGSIAPISELQSRWVARVFAGRATLPPPQAMLVDIETKRQQLRRRYFQSHKHTVQVDFVDYMDELADQINVRPPLFSYAFTDPRFLFRLIVGGNLPYVYRLVGPGSWCDAKATIDSVPIRVKRALKHRECRMRRSKRRGTLDEYFRYASFKWFIGWFLLLLFVGIWVFCSGPTGIPLWQYGSYVLLFAILMYLFFQWFNIQWDMSTMI